MKTTYEIKKQEKYLKDIGDRIIHEYERKREEFGLENMDDEYQVEVMATIKALMFSRHCLNWCHLKSLVPPWAFLVNDAKDSKIPSLKSEWENLQESLLAASQEDRG